MASKKHGRGAALTGLALAAVAGAYFLFGKKGKEHRQRVKGWYLKAKGEVLDKIERARDIDKAQYMKIVDDVAKRYRKMKNVSTKEISTLSRELKSHWGAIQKEFKKKKR